MDVRKVKQLLALMAAHNLAEIEIEEEGMKIRLRKNPAGAIEISPTTLAFAPMTPVSAAVPASPAQQKTEAKEQLKDTIEIKSPMVGTFYSSPAPEAEPFVKVGQVVNEDTVVCIIEAMKVMNEIKAEASGEVVAVLLESGDAIEFGQPLMVIKPVRSETAQALQ